MNFKTFKKGVVLGVAILAICALSVPTAFAQLNPLSVPKYAVPMPVIQDAGLRVDATRGGTIRVDIVNSTHDFGLEGAIGQTPLTPIYAYKFPGLPATYPGATFVAERDMRVNVMWRNMVNGADVLFPAGHVLNYLVDDSLHIANPVYGVPVVTHLHGGHSESASDGLPEAWYTQNWDETGNYHVKRNYRYDNTQEAATLWYHDHALGITRLNVYAGLAGFYLLRDDNEYYLIDNDVIPNGDEEIEVVIQDRMFTTEANGYLLTLPTTGESECVDGKLPDIDVDCDTPVPDPSIVAEFFGDIIVVNGKVWPKLNVEPRLYRFRLLNGSDSRFYVLQLRDTQTGGSIFDNGDYPIWVIGTDDGLLDNPVRAASGGHLDTLMIGPGERYDLVVDLTSAGDRQVFLRNYGPDDPFKGFTAGGAVIGPTADPATTGQIMRFDVADVDPFDPPENWEGASTELRPMLPAIPVVSVDDADNADDPRGVALFEGFDNFGRLQPLLGTVADGTLTWDDAITENPDLNSTEVWEVYNTTEDAHPIHLHLVTFRVINREGFSFTTTARELIQHDGSIGQGADLNITGLAGGAVGPETWEDGWKDTIAMYPSQVTRIIALFDRPGRYVWHCHILSHEDHEMMRPFHVGPLPAGPPFAPPGPPPM